MAASSSNGEHVKQQLRELQRIVTSIQPYLPSSSQEEHDCIRSILIKDERVRNEDNLSNINKTHEKMRHDNKVSSYFKNKLKGLYATGVTDAKSEIELIQEAMDKISEIKSNRTDKRSSRQGPPTSHHVYKDESRKGMRRGVLMSMLQQSAVKLPVWSGRAGESPPALCGAIPAESSYVSRPNDHVAARVKGSDGEEQWILAEVHSYSPATSKYEVDDIDSSDDVGKPCQERHSPSRRRVIPLPLWKANPNEHMNALFQTKQLVLALYPQTTCFYRALISEPPASVDDDYVVLFEDSSYADGYSPPLHVPQLYVVHHKKR